MSLLEKSAWQGKIFSNGWVSGSGGEYPVTETMILVNDDRMISLA
jgi:hypothetical protein